MRSVNKIAVRSTARLVKRNIALYILVLPAFAYIIIFCYWPMYGIQIAFRNFTISKGITGSPWAGTKWFDFFFKSPMFTNVLTNTLAISFYSLLAGFPVPILLALMLNNIGNQRYRRMAQTVTYLPHFISTVVVVALISMFFSPSTGFINHAIKSLTGFSDHYMARPQYFRHLYVWSGIWQSMGWNSIIYMAALTGISPELHEAAMIDGASKLQRIWHVELPGIMPTMVILLIMNAGSIMSVGYEKVYLMQNSLNISVSEVIATYTYKMGLVNQKYSYSAAISLFNNVINFTMLTIVNFVSKKLSDTSLW